MLPFRLLDPLNLPKNATFRITRPPSMTPKNATFELQIRSHPPKNVTFRLLDSLLSPKNATFRITRPPSTTPKSATFRLLDPLLTPKKPPLCCQVLPPKTLPLSCPDPPIAQKCSLSVLRVPSCSPRSATFMLPGLPQSTAQKRYL